MGGQWDIETLRQQGGGCRIKRKLQARQDFTHYRGTGSSLGSCAYCSYEDLMLRGAASAAEVVPYLEEPLGANLVL